MKNILVVVAHPHPKQSKFNTNWAQAAQQSGSTVHILAENLRADGSFDLEKEKQLLLSHDIVVLSFPLWWYNMPWLLSKWFAEALTAGFAYGKTHFLDGKILSCLISCGGPADAYSHAGLAHKTIAEFLPSIPATASYCGMKYVDPFVFYGAHSATPEQITQSASDAITHLNGLST